MSRYWASLTTGWRKP